MPENILMALKPVWLLGCGAGLGLAVLFLIAGVIAAASRPARTAFVDLARETVIWPVLLVALLLASFSLMASGLDLMGFRFFDQKRAAWESVLRLTKSQTHDIKTEVAPNAEEWPIPVQVAAGELWQLKIQSSQPIVATVNQPDDAARPTEERILVQPNEPFSWTRAPDAMGPLTGAITKLYFHPADTTEVAAAGGKAAEGKEAEARVPAQVQISISTQPVVPQAVIIPITALGLVVYVGFFLLLQAIFPKVAAVAVATAREAMSQPLYYLLLAASTVFLLALLFTPFFTFGEDVRQFKDSGLTTIMVFSIFFAVWTASVSVSDEIEGRTALTVLSKPIGRREFVLGKYLGIVAPVAVNFILVGTFFLVITSYKVVYDARESADPNVVWQQCYMEMAQTAPGLLLAFMETAVLASISVAIATRLPLLPNLTICTSIYMIGHLLPLLIKSTAGRFEIVYFMGQLFGTILPVLDHFNVYAPIAAGKAIPLAYVGLVAIYSLTYITIAMLFALALFEDRDLA